MMKRYRFMLSLAMAGFLAAACEDEQIVNMTPSRPAEIGEEIIFGARAGFENANPDTRTVYGDTYEENGVKYDRIDWVDGIDKIQIMSPEATTPGMSGSDAHTAHYVVKDASEADDNDNTTVDRVDEAYLEKMAETAPALQWGTGIESDINGDGIAEQGVHTFYAMYPSVQMFINEDGSIAESMDRYIQYIDMNTEKISGYIHTTQYPDEITSTTSDGHTHWTAKPDMSYAYMVAKSMASRNDGYVNLIFFPLVTALEIQMILPTSNDYSTVENVTIGSVNISGDDIAGTFEATYPANWTGGEAFPEGNITSGSIKGNSVSISTAGIGGDYVLTLKPGDSFTFTVFLKPTANLTNLKAGITLDLVGLDKKSITLENVTVYARKKNILTGLKLPIVTTSQGVPYDKWMEVIHDDETMQGISLPGTGNSFTRDAGANFKSQGLNFNEQWEVGIRAFEIATNRQKDRTSTSNTFEDLPITCGGTEIDANLTVSSVFTDIIRKLAANPYETAMLILNYQPVGSDPKRNGPNYMYQLNRYLTTGTVTLEGNQRVNIIDKLVQYSPYLQLGSYDKDTENNDILENGSSYTENGTKKPGARGRLMVLVRPSSADEPDFADMDATDDNIRILTGTNENDEIYTAIENQIDQSLQDKILVLRGCGTSKDKWGARGYNITEGTKATVDAPNISNEFYKSENGNIYIEKYMAPANGNGNPIFASPEQTTYKNSGSYTIPSYNAYSTSISYNNTSTSVTIDRPAFNTLPTGEEGNVELEFDYVTNTGQVCWYQEWARVIGQKTYVQQGKWTDPTSSRTTRNYQRIYWFESYQEKLSNAKVTFDMAVSGEYAAKGYTFINSLCGYYTTGTPTVSVTPSVHWAYGGDYGNIQNLATPLNKDFYDYVSAAANNNKIKAPMGVILMDFVSNNPNDGGGYWLPQLIIANNEFKAGIDNDLDDDDKPVDKPGEEDW